jgi:transcriptional regulator with XRE-family HTH domain
MVRNWRSFLRMGVTQQQSRSVGKIPRDHSPERLRAARVAAGLSRADLAAAAGISPSHLAELENDTRNASAAALRRLAQALGCQTTDLMPETRVPAQVAQ